MPRVLLIGDVHAKVDDLEDCEHLIGVIKDIECKEKPQAIIFLGDLYDAFAVKNVVVERWWMETIDRLEAPLGKYLILGNHDRPGDSTAVGHALQTHARQLNTYVVDGPFEMFSGDNAVLLLPFYFKAEDFVAAAGMLPGDKTVICHQSFIGGKYESGQPIEARHDASAVDPAAIPQRWVVAGHIHTPQTVGKVWYTGSPRWRNNVSDANIDRFIYAVDFDGGLPTAIRKYPTGDACRRIWKVDITPDTANTKMPFNMKPNDRVVLDISGPAAFIETIKKNWSGSGARIRAFQTDRPGPKLSEAQGVKAAWAKWAGEYEPKHGTNGTTLETMARTRLSL